MSLCIVVYRGCTISKTPDFLNLFKLIIMENISDFLKSAVTFQDFAQKRGYELMMALGCKWLMYESADMFECELDGVVMRFSENTQHDCPDSETICLKIEELQLNDEDWGRYIEKTKIETQQKKAAAKQKEEQDRRQFKERQFEQLKKELGY